jgi:hypothetical protein
MENSNFHFFGKNATHAMPRLYEASRDTIPQSGGFGGEFEEMDLHQSGMPI